MRLVVLFNVIFGGEVRGVKGKTITWLKDWACQLYNFVQNIMEYVVYYSSIV